MLGINALLLSDYKKYFLTGGEKKKWTFKFVNSCHFLIHPTMHLPKF
jgi:hypothetical protein